MITCTGVEDFVSNRFRIDRLFQVVDGTVTVSYTHLDVYKRQVIFMAHTSSNINRLSVKHITTIIIKHLLNYIENIRLRQGFL